MESERNVAPFSFRCIFLSPYSPWRWTLLGIRLLDQNLDQLLSPLCYHACKANTHHQPDSDPCEWSLQYRWLFQTHMGLPTWMLFQNLCAVSLWGTCTFPKHPLWTGSDPVLFPCWSVLLIVNFKGAVILTLNTKRNSEFFFGSLSLINSLSMYLQENTLKAFLSFGRSLLWFSQSQPPNPFIPFLREMQAGQKITGDVAPQGTHHTSRRQNEPLCLCLRAERRRGLAVNFTTFFKQRRVHIPSGMSRAHQMTRGSVVRHRTFVYEFTIIGLEQVARFE